MPTRHRGYYADHFRGQIVYRCCTCAYDSFAEDNTAHHVRSHQTYQQYTLAELEALGLGRALEGTRIAIGVITSDTDWPSSTLLKASQERSLAEAMGSRCSVVWVDNGTKDPETLLDNAAYAHNVTLFNTNMGQSIARNRIIDYCVDNQVQYLLMVDGDIEIIPYSIWSMVNKLGHGVGCFGLNGRNCTDLDDDVSECMHVGELRCSTPGQAWTQYGMFDCTMFQEGIRFDTHPVFQGPGWGFEDDDLYCQMLSLGYESINTTLFRYAHHRMHSSLKAMDLKMATLVHAARKHYLINKWGSHPNPRVIRHIERLANQTMPVLDF